MPSILYTLNGGDWREGYEPPQSYTAGEPFYQLPTGTDIVKSTEPADFLAWYSTEDFSGEPVAYIPASATSTYNLYAKWVKFTPDASGQADEIDILTSGIYPYEFEGHSPIRVLFGVKQVKDAVSRPVGTIEIRDANTGEFLYDYTDMKQVATDNASINRLVIGNYVFYPHTSDPNTLDGDEDDSLFISYMGE